MRPPPRKQCLERLPGFPLRLGARDWSHHSPSVQAGSPHAALFDYRGSPSTPARHACSCLLSTASCSWIAPSTFAKPFLDAQLVPGSHNSSSKSACTSSKLPSHDASTSAWWYSGQLSIAKSKRLRCLRCPCCTCFQQYGLGKDCCSMCIFAGLPLAFCLCFFCFATE